MYTRISSSPFSASIFGFETGILVFESIVHPHHAQLEYSQSTPAQC
jgi:hypothetical protein